MCSALSVTYIRILSLLTSYGREPSTYACILFTMHEFAECPCEQDAVLGELDRQEFVQH